MADGERDIAVIGCGALGLTSAILLQRAGAKVTIYAKERPPDVRSARATGSWTPDSRIALTTPCRPDFPALWERCPAPPSTRTRATSACPAIPLSGLDRYSSLIRRSPPRRTAPQAAAGAQSDFARYRGPRCRSHPARHGTVAPAPSLSHVATPGATSSLTSMHRRLLPPAGQRFLIEGGKIRNVEFHSPADLTRSIAEKG